MRRKRHSPEQVVRRLREAEAGLSAGMSVEEACKGFVVSPQTAGEADDGADHRDVT